MIIQEAQDLAVATLADCPAFQALVGVATAEEAAEKIFQDALPEPKGDRWTANELDAIRPFALAFTEEDVTGFTYQYVATGKWQAAGAIKFKIERSVKDIDSPASADRDFRDLVGKIILEFANKRNTGGLLSRRIMIDGPYRIAEEDLAEQGDYQWMEVLVEWGID